MTREEAIERFKTDIYKYTDFTENPNENEFWMAFDMAIEALEQQTCEDAISRKDTLAKFKKTYFDNKTVIRCAELVIGGMPSVQPEQEPCEDCISREDALMALTGEWTESTDELIHRFIRRIKNLPSVNPAKKQEPCEDVVSREAVLGLFAQNADAVRPYSKTWEEVKDLPSVNPQTKTGWIPVSERLPEKKGRYLTTIFNEYDNSLRYIMTCDYLSDGSWCPDDECASSNVVAWMPLPQPYEPQERSKE